MRAVQHGMVIDLKFPVHTTQEPPQGTRAVRHASLHTHAHFMHHCIRMRTCASALFGVPLAGRSGRKGT